MVVSTRNGDASASGDWTWKSYAPWKQPIHHNNYIQIQMRDERGIFSYSSGFAAHEFKWMSGSANQVEKSGTPIHFALTRPSGEWNFHGKQVAWGTAGTFIFEPNTQFAAEVEEICKTRPTLQDLIKLSFSNASIEDMWRFRAAGLSLDVNSWLRLMNHGISPDYASDMKWALGKIDVDAVIECRNNGMTSEYASGFSRAGYALNHKDLIRLRNHGVQPEFAAELKRGGMTLNVDQLIRLRNSGVSSDYALRIWDQGYGETIEDIIRMRNSGVSEDFIAEVRQSDHRLSIDEIIKLRNSGVPSSYLSAVKKAGYSFTPDEVIRLRNHGVTEDFLAEIMQPGRKPLSVDTIVDLRSRGVSAETIRAIRAE